MGGRREEGGSGKIFQVILESRSRCSRRLLISTATVPLVQGGYHAGSAVAAAPDTCTADHGIEQLVQSRGMVKKGEAKAAVENKIVWKL